MKSHSDTNPLDLSGKYTQKILGNIVFNNVNYSYPSRNEEPVFTNLSLSIKGGTIVGIVGESGLGKSTILQFLVGFYNITAGSITIDNIPIQLYNIQSLREKICYISQSYHLFPGTVS